MIKQAISNPYAVFVGMAIVVMFGLLAMLEIPIQLKPTIEPAQITITTFYWGASPLEVEDQISNKIEQEVSGINDLKLVTSNSQEGISTVSLEFIDNVDKNKALIDTIQALKRVTDLPELATEPQVVLGSSGQGEQIMWINVEGTLPLMEKWDLIDEIVQPTLLRTNGVGGVIFFGGAERKIVVEPDPQRLADYSISLGELARAVQTQNMNARGGYVDEGDRQFLVRTLGKYKTTDEVEQTVIRHGPEGTLTVGDVATVVDGRERQTGYVEVNSVPTVVMGVDRQSDANTVTTIHALQGELARFNQRFEDAGMDVKLVEVYSELHYVEDAISLVRNNLMLGAILAAIVLALFLRAGRPIAIVIVTIPVSLISVFIVLQMLDRTINIVSLAGLAFSVGMVVDNAIVVLENIDRHLRQLGKSPWQAALDGITEIAGAILASTLTTLAVFVPIMLNTTEAGLLFKDIAIAIVSAVAMSFIAAITLVPSLSALLLKKESTREKIAKENPKLDALLNTIELQWLGRAVENYYHDFLRSISTKSTGSKLKRWGFLSVVFVAFLASLLLLPGANYLPNGTREFIFCMGWPLVGQQNATTMEALSTIQEYGDTSEKIDGHFAVAASPMFTGMGLVVKREYANDTGLAAVVKEVQELSFGKLTGFRFFQPFRASIFQTQDKQFTLEVTGEDLEQIKKISDMVMGGLYGMMQPGPNGEPPLVVFPMTEYSEGVPELAIELDRHRVNEVGEDLFNVAQSVEMMIGGRDISTYSDAGREYDLMIRGNPDLVKDRDALKRLPLVTRTGDIVRLDELADFDEGSGPTAIRHYNRTRSISITVNTNPIIPTQIAMDIVDENLIQPIVKQLPPGYSVRFGDAADKLRNTLGSLALQSLLAITIVYLLMVALFRSFRQPMVILVTIPLAWSGSFIALTIANKVTNGVVQLDVLGMLGLIILTGIVVNNAILIVHQTNNNENDGLLPHEALREAAESRLRPIFMSVLTSVCGMLPLALGQGSGSELYRGLGIIVVGGLLVSTIFTLFVVPTILSLIQDGKQARMDRAAEQQAQD